AAIKVELYGSLALTGKGHGTDRAVLMGLEGETPESIDPDSVGARVEAIQQNQQITLLKQQTISFSYTQDLLFYYQEVLPKHSNGMRFTAYDKQQQLLH